MSIANITCNYVHNTNIIMYKYTFLYACDVIQQYILTMIFIMKLFGFYLFNKCTVFIVFSTIFIIGNFGRVTIFRRLL